VDGDDDPQDIRDSRWPSSVQSVSDIFELEVVIRRGAPAQREEARRLAEILALEPDNRDAREAARQLVDAYLHDPYLEKE
jgi:hypothetical protein